jgi:hypothetical protein
MFWNILLHGESITYNCGGFSNVSIKELANIIGHKLNKEVKIPTSTISLVGSPKVVNISIEKYLQEFNKTSFVNINEGLSKTIEWNKNIN